MSTRRPRRRRDAAKCSLCFSAPRPRRTAPAARACRRRWSRSPRSRSRWAWGSRSPRCTAGLRGRRLISSGRSAPRSRPITSSVAVLARPGELTYTRPPAAAARTRATSPDRPDFFEAARDEKVPYALRGPGSALRPRSSFFAASKAFASAAFPSASETCLTRSPPRSGKKRGGPRGAAAANAPAAVAVARRVFANAGRLHDLNRSNLCGATASSLELRARRVMR